MKTKRMLLSSNKKLPVAALVAGLFIIAGSVLLFRGSAATPFFSLQAEGGTLASPASVVPASDASGGSAVKFGTTATGVTLWQIPNPALPTVETAAYAGMTGDIADDMAIYAHPTEPAKSVVIGANKATAGGGVAVFDMQGNMKQFRKDGYIANIDQRPFRLGGRDIVLLGANDRGNNTIEFWEYNPSTQQLSAPLSAQDIFTATGAPNYGFCFYRSNVSGELYAFVTPNGAGSIEQYRIFDNGGRVDATKVRTIAISSISESCVADDKLGRLYVSQEDVALWRYNAEPNGGTTRTQVEGVGLRLVADAEGVAIAYGPNDTGYLVLSSQGNSTFLVYDRQTNAFIRSFKVPANGAIDASSGTDGLDITVSSMGPGFEKGVLVVHDEANSGGVTSNLKYVPLN